MKSSIIKCQNCNKQFQGKYCNYCGEKVYAEKDKTIGHFFEDAIHFITHFEGTLFTTLKTMATRPGQYSLDYTSGIRKRYMKPLSLFLVLVILYLLFPIFEGLNMEMKYYSSSGYFGKFAEQQINAALTRTGLDEEQLSKLFHLKAEKLSKIFLITIIPVTALFFKAILFKKKKYFYDYLVYSTEVNIVFLLWGFLILPLLISLVLLFNVPIVINDFISGILIYLFFCVYVAISLRNFFQLSWWKCILIGIIFFPIHSFIIINIYKYILFMLTISQF